MAVNTVRDYQFGLYRESGSKITKSWREEGQGPELLLGGTCVPPAGEAETCSSQKDWDAEFLARVSA